MAGSWLERYIGGEHEAVWGEIQSANLEAIGEGARAQAHAVVREMMQRARRNIEIIIERLECAGYEFVDPAAEGCPPRVPLVPPSEASPQFLRWLGELTGPIPATVAEWITTVGDVNLVGNHPEWPERDLETDALVVEFELRGYAERGPGWGAEDFFQNELDAWQEDVAEYGAAVVGRFVLPFSPDLHHKINVSGGDSYGIYLPDESIDATCRINGRDISFVEYVRNCFRCGGFPGAATLPQVKDLCRDLLPI